MAVFVMYLDVEATKTHWHAFMVRSCGKRIILEHNFSWFNISRSNQESGKLKKKTVLPMIPLTFLHLCPTFQLLEIGRYQKDSTADHSKTHEGHDDLENKISFHNAGIEQCFWNHKRHNKTP